VIVVMYFKEPAEAPASIERLRASGASVAAALFAGLAVLYLGITPAKVVAIAEEAVKIFT
jgi:NADH:ubiquinone oxidoreductase subunit 2 (subunit N)